MSQVARPRMRWMSDSKENQTQADPTAPTSFNSKGEEPEGVMPTQSANSDNLEFSVAESSRLYKTQLQSGDLLAGRFRVVTALGRGGMGEVYRADDLALGVPVALKFLPDIVSTDAHRLSRFRNEIATARLVSHPNVCRVFDIAESNGQVFLSMEFITGDTLAAILKKVGRLEVQLAIDLSRQIALGLNAVHDEGLIHRDIKPANVMLDSRGRAKLTDFGLAASADEVTGAESRSGTPAYQAPEQLAGESVTRLSDIYAYGLLVYELLTGQRPFIASSTSKLLELQLTTTPPLPSTFSPTVPPEVDQIVMRCLAPNPHDRPRSAHEIWRSLPGDEALRAVLAAGETPTAELVADAGGEGSLTNWKALTAIATIVLFLMLAMFLKDSSTTLRTVPLPLNLGQLESRAKSYLKNVGYDAPIADETGQFIQQYDYEDWSLLHDRTTRRWSSMVDGRAGLFYRYQSSTETFPSLAGRHTDRAQASSRPGWSNVYLDSAGRLVRLEYVPFNSNSSNATLDPRPSLDPWLPLFQNAGLDMALFVSTKPSNEWEPGVPVDQRFAWSGKFPGREEWPLRIEAGLYRNSPVYFRCIFPWDVPPNQNSWGSANAVSPIASWLLELTLYIVGSFFAFRNLSRERVDWRGTIVMIIATIVAWFFGIALAIHHVADFSTELDRLAHVLGMATWSGIKLGIAYLAVEPYVRRHWPWQLVGWARLLHGRWRDPKVGADVLIGIAAGLIFASSYLSLLELPGWLGYPKNPRYGMAFIGSPLSDAPYLLAHALTRTTLVFFAAFLLFRLFRKPWIGFVATVIVSTAFLANYSTDTPWIYYAGCGALGVFGVSILLRFGLLTGTAVLFTHYFVCRSLITWELTTWYTLGTALHLGIFIALVIYGYFGAIGKCSQFVRQ